MINLSLVIRKSKPNADGSFNIKVLITSNGQSSFLSTRHSVDNASQFVNGRVRGRLDAKAMNLKLSQLLSRCEEIVEELSNFSMPAKGVKDYIEKRLYRPATLQGYAEEYISKAAKNGQKSYAQNLGYSIR